MEGAQEHIMTDGWQEMEGPLEFSCEKIEIMLDGPGGAQGVFRVNGKPGQPLEGYVYSSDARMTSLTEYFCGYGEEIGYSFDGSRLSDQEECEGRFLLVTNYGEYELPFHVSVKAPSIISSQGEIRSLFDFAGLARNNWQEAVKLYYSAGFQGLLKGEEGGCATLYRGLSGEPGNEQNMEEFLIAAGKKQPVEYVLPRQEILLQDVRGNIRESLPVVRNGWGYTRLRVEAEGDFIVTEKKRLSDEDFLGNQCVVQVFIESEKLHGGKNFGKIRLIGVYGSLEIPVLIVQNAREKGMRALRRQEVKKLTVSLMKLYQSYRMKKTAAGEWRIQAAQIIERLKRISDGEPAVRLFEAHLLITEERLDEAKWLLQREDIMPDEEDPALYAYYLYLTTLYGKGESHTSQVMLQVQDLYRSHRDNWRIAWLMLFLSPDLNRSIPQKWMFIEEQFKYDATSPLLYLEALHLLNLTPTLLLKLGSYEIQLLYYGARHGILSDDLTGHMIYLMGKEKYYKESLYRILCFCCKGKPDDQLLQAICTLLIKGNKTGREYYEWYRQGVERKLRVTRLYEYYLMSVDLEEEIRIPRMVLMYFAYQSNLDYERGAYLYAYILRHKEEHMEIYLTYKSQIDRFVLSQLSRGRINRDLGYLYQNMLSEKLLTKESAQELAAHLFTYQLDCKEPGARRTVVVHGKRKGEQSYPVEGGHSFISVYDKDCEIFWEDGEHNRFAVGEDGRPDRLIYLSALWKSLDPLVENVPGYNLAICGDENRKVVSSQVKRYQELAEEEETEPAFARKIRMKLIRYYYEKERMEELDMFLDSLQPEEIDGGERYEAVRYLALRGFSRKAYEWMKGLTPSGQDEKILLRLCSRLLDMELCVDEAWMTDYIFSAFERGKYDSRLLSQLIRYFDGSTQELLQIRDAAENFAVDVYELNERLLVRLLYTHADVTGYVDIFRQYVADGGRSEVETAFLHRFSGLYLRRQKPLAPYILTSIGRAARREENLSDMCRLAYLSYYSEHRDERSESTDLLIQRFGEELLRKGMKLPLLKEYADILEGADSLLDKTIVVYQGREDRQVSLSYRILSQTQEPPAYATCEMQHMYAGIYAACFVLFAGESLQYFITAQNEPGASLDNGLLKAGALDGAAALSRYGQLNEILTAGLLQNGREKKELLERYLYTEWMTEGLF